MPPLQEALAYSFRSCLPDFLVLICRCCPSVTVAPQVRVVALNQQGIGDYSAPKWLKAGASTPLAPDVPVASFCESRVRRGTGTRGLGL